MGSGNHHVRYKLFNHDAVNFWFYGSISGASQSRLLNEMAKRLERLLLSLMVIKGLLKRILRKD